MQVWIDDTQLEAATNLDAAFETARAHAEQHGRLIIDVLADGSPIDDALIDAPPTDSTAGISELRLTTTEPRAFMTETAHNAKEALLLTREDQQRAADLLRQGEVPSAMESLKAALEGWHAVRDVVGQTALLAEIDIDALSFTPADAQQTTGAQTIEQLSATLEEVRSSIGSQDWSSLGDAIEYDLSEQSRAWEALLDEMIARIGKDA